MDQRVDLIAITGLPRSGTTFLTQLFHTCNFENILCVSNKEDFSFGSVCPAVFGQIYADDVSSYTIFHQFVDYWRTVANNPNITIVYKHPQLLFAKDIPNDLNIKYIFCHREYDSWYRSFSNIEKGFIDGIYDDRNQWLVHNWPCNWYDPIETKERSKTYYDLFNTRIGLMKEMNRDKFVDFIFEEPERSLMNISDFLGVNININTVMNEIWRKPKFNIGECHANCQQN